jgi:hypothetical protein
MKSQLPHFRLILPTGELMEEFRQANTLLSLVHADVKQVMAYVADYYLHDKLSDPIGYSRVRELLAFIQTDFLYEYRYDRHDSRDIHDIRMILTALAEATYDLVDKVIVSQRLPDRTIHDLDVEGWLGDSMVISTEKEGLGNWKQRIKPSSLQHPPKPHFINRGW